MGDMFIDKASAVLGKVLDGASARQRVLANNIANAETPGFTRQDLDFEDQLREAMDDPSADFDSQIAAIEQVALGVTDDTKTPARADGNNVDIEREMTNLAKNSLQYETASQLLSMKLRGLNTAIHEGR